MVLGTTEPREQALLDSNLKIGGVFYDIGANIGFYATLAGRLVGPDGRVYAFEPHPQTAQRCRENASRNGFQHVEIVQAAVSSFDGSSPLFLGEGSTENNISHEVADRIGPSVTVITVDEWRLNKNARLPTLVLIDAEGQEIEVLKGMRSTIVAAKPVLMIEVHWLGESFTNFVRSELEPLGYRFSTYDGKVLPTGICRFHALGIAHR
jgi:FkbM family methyltransferase